MARNKKANHRNLLVGFAKRDLTPPLPFPLAGMATKQERLAERVRDPLYARAMAFGNGRRTVLVIAGDLLMITAPLREAVERRLAERQVQYAGLMLSATHSHSSTGGYWDAPSARLFMGAYRPEIFTRLAEGIAAAAEAAVDDLRPASLDYGETQTSYLNYNRRFKEGAIDRTLGVLTVRREDDTLRVLTFGAHPVVVGFRDYHAASADYPGELLKTFAGEDGLFLVGPVGGVNVLYPEGPLDGDVHLHLLARLLREEADKAIAVAQPVHGDAVAFAAGEMTVRIVAPPLLPDRLRWLDAALYPVRLYVRHFGRGGLRDGMPARVPVVRVGDLVFTGFPADLGASVGLAARVKIAARGLRPAAVASHTDDYVGYVHLPEDYQQFASADKGEMWMNIYENAMGFGGRHVGIELLDAFEGALAEVCR
ncbi:MAG: hypothetical protein GX444_02310 [Myxococcales bacterium]|nr:hypothetical protein [Myxococcales bacterium]